MLDSQAPALGQGRLKLTEHKVHITREIQESISVKTELARTTTEQMDEAATAIVAAFILGVSTVEGHR